MTKPSHPSPQGHVRTLVAVLAGMYALLLLHAWRYMPFFEDDAFISLRYAKRLLAGQGLTWNDGPAVEGYTNFLWTILCAALGFVGMDLVFAARLLGVLCMAGLFVAIGYRFRRATTADLYGAAICSAFIACSGSIAAWTIGGLEMPLYAMSLAWGIVMLMEIVEGDTSWRAVLGAGAAFGAMSITRPDGVMLTAVLVLAAMFYMRGNMTQVRAAVLTAVAAAVPVLAVLAFRLSYYHDWVPNSAHVKFNTSSHYVDLGLTYALNGLGGQWPLWIALVAGIVIWLRSGTKRPVAVTHALRIMSLGMIAWMAYDIMIGGDIFPGMRLWIPVTLFLAMLTAELTRTITTSPSARTTAGFALGALIAAYGVTQWFDTQNHDARVERWEWEGKEVGLYMKARFGPLKPLLAIEPGGAVPYYSDLDCLDMFGLNDPYIGAHPSSTPGTGFPGHDAVNTAYVLQRKPDIVLVGFPRGKGWHGRWQVWGSLNSRELHVSTEFLNSYQLVEFVELPSKRLITTLHLRKDSPRIPWDALRAAMIADGVVGVRREELTAVPEILQ